MPDGILLHATPRLAFLGSSPGLDSFSWSLRTSFFITSWSFRCIAMSVSPSFSSEAGSILSWTASCHARRWFWKKTASILSVGASCLLAGCSFFENSSAGRLKLRMAWSNLWCATSLNTALGDARWKFQEMPWSSLAHLSPRFHVCSVGDERVPLESAHNSDVSFYYVLFHGVGVIVTPPRDRAIHILNQYDSFTRVPADPGIYKSPDYVLLASVVGGED